MSSVLSQYLVMQQAEWAGRKFYNAQDRRTGQVVYLMAEPSRYAPNSYRHPSLPHLQPLAVEADTRWLIGTLPQGQLLEDMRRDGSLTESDVYNALLSVLDAMTVLAACEPPLVPAYLDPACIKRDWLGRWILDYMALAQAPETRSSNARPYGVYPFGTLLYWLLTGNSSRMRRIQVTKIPAGTTPSVQYILIRCLGRSYLSLAELRIDVERAGRDHEFGPMVKLFGHPDRENATAPPPAPEEWEAETADPAATPPPGMPPTPAEDRSWALPERPAEGFQNRVDPPPDPKAGVRRRRAIGVPVGVLTVAMAAVIPLWMGWIPDAYLPGFLRPVPRVSGYPGMATADGQIGAELPANPVGLSSDVASRDVGTLERFKELVRQSEQASPQPAAEPATAEPAPASEAVKPPAQPTAPPKANPPTTPTTPPAPPPKPRTPPVTPPTPPPPPKPPAPPTTPPTTQPAPPPQPSVKQPEPGTADYRDAVTGAMPTLVYVNERPLRHAWLFPHPRNPYLSMETFNSLFGKSVIWMPGDAGIRLLSDGKTFLTLDYLFIQDRVWLKLTPALQQSLGVQVKAYSESGIYFTVNP